MKNYSHQVIITLNHSQEHPQSGLDLRVAAQSVLLMKGEASVPTNLSDSDSDSARKPAYHYFYIRTPGVCPGNLNTITDASIRLMKPWIMTECIKCKVLVKHLIILVIHKRRNIFLFKSKSFFRIFLNQICAFLWLTAKSFFSP